MIELSNELIAASSCVTDFPIIIVDLCSYAIVEVIKERKKENILHIFRLFVY